MSNILKYQNPSSPLLDPHKIIKNIPAREWGPYKINEDGTETRGMGTTFALTPFQYWGNKGLGLQNEKLARDLISDFDKMKKDNPDYNYTLDKNYKAYEDAIHYIDHLEGLKKYLGLPYDTSALVESTYKPTRLQGTSEKTYKFKSSTSPGYWNDTVEDMIMGEYDKMGGYWDQSLHEFTAYRDRDEKGDFISIYDEWDYNPAVRGGNKKLNKVIDSVTGGKPFVIYDRVYLDDYYDIPEEARGNPFITPAVVTAEAKKSGGIIKAQNSAKLISKINQSGVNFVKRLLDPDRKSIPDWETKGQKIATHKMSWGEDDQGAYVFPEVQEIDDQLIDFSRPPYAPGIADYMAHKNNNIIRMSPEEADWFTRNYKQYYPSFKKGGHIHIKKKNRGKFTEYCGGKVTEECIARGKRSKNPLTRKRANFASVVRKWKHENGGLLKYQNPATTLGLPEGSVYGGELEPAVVKPAPLYGVLNTYYPVISEFPFTGHSELQIVDFGWDKPLTISKYGTDHDYNLVTNNCSDATRCAVEKIFGEKINPVLFTTPGDVQDFVAEKTGQKPVKEDVGQTALGFNIPFATAMDLKNQNLDFYIQDYLHKAAKMKKQMKEENPNWNSDSFDLSTAEVIQRYKDQKYKFQPFKDKNGGILKAQDGTGNNFWSKLWNAIKEGGMAARDAKIGAVGAQQVRDLYSEGKNQEAQDLAKQYAKANTTGIALAGGAASTGLLGDLMVTGATTTADTFIDGDVDNFGKNLVKNAAGDLIGHGTSKLLTHLRTNELNKYIDYLNESRRQELFPKSEDVYYHIDTDGRPLFNTNAKLHPSKDASRVLPGLARDEGDIPYIWFNRRATYGTPKHDRIVFGSKEDLHLKPIQETNLPHNEVEGFYVTEGYPNTDKIQMYRGYPISIGGTKPIYVFGKEIFYAPK